MVNDERLEAAALNDLYTAVDWNADNERTEAKTSAMLQASPCFVAAWVEDQLVGFGRILADPYNAQILDVMTHPDYWKRGVASGVMERLLEFARGQFPSVMLIAGGGLEAFYTRFGFVAANPQSGVLMFLSYESEDESPRNTQNTLIDESWYERPEGVRERLNAGGVVVRLEKDNLKVAFVHETGQERLFLPKGGVEAGENLLTAARREITEEAGVSDLTMVIKLGVRERMSYKKTYWSVTHYFLFSTEQIEGTPTDEEHEYRLEWHDLDRLPPLVWPEQRALIETNRETIKMFLAP